MMSYVLVRGKRKRISNNKKQDISVSLLAGGLLLGPTILLYQASFTAPNAYLRALTEGPSAVTQSLVNSTNENATTSPTLSVSSTVDGGVRSSSSDDELADDAYQRYWGSIPIGSSGLTCYEHFPISDLSRVHFCSCMIVAVLCGVGAFIGFIVNAIHVIVADSRGEYLLERPH